MQGIDKLIGELATSTTLLMQGRSFGLTISATEEAAKQIADSNHPGKDMVLGNIFPVLPRANIFKSINTERDGQDAKWGGQQHDQKHTPNDWVAYIAKHAGKAADGDNFRAQMAKVAALAVAAIEAHDASKPLAKADKLCTDPATDCPAV